MHRIHDKEIEKEITSQNHPYHARKQTYILQDL